MAARHTRRELLRRGAALALLSGLPPNQRAWARGRATDPALDALARGLATGASGQIIRPGDPGHAKIRGYNARFDCIRTTTYLRPDTTEGVRKILAWATTNRRTFAIRGGGHSFEGKSSHPDLVIDMSHLTRHRLGGDGVLNVQAGVLLGDVYKTLGAASRVLPAGTCPTVGLVGHTLGGGLGDFLPMFGYAAQSLKSVTLVTMNGTILQVDDQAIEVLGGAPLPPTDLKAPNLMRILRGGGQGSVGVVTDMTFQTVDVQTTKLASFHLDGAIGLSPARTVAILEAWQSWRERLPKAMQSVVSSKVNLSRTNSGHGLEIAGLIAVPPASTLTVAEVRQTLDALFHMPEWKTRFFSKPLTAMAAMATFIDDDATSNNPARRMLHGASTVLPAALPRPSLEHLVQHLRKDVFVSFYTTGGASKTGPPTSLHPSEFLIEWGAWSARPVSDGYRKIKSITTAMLAKAGVEDLAFPNYPSPEARRYFSNQSQIEAARTAFDPAGLSTSSLLADTAQSGGESCR